MDLKRLQLFLQLGHPQPGLIIDRRLGDTGFTLLDGLLDFGEVLERHTQRAVQTYNVRLLPSAFFLGQQLLLGDSRCNRFSTELLNLFRDVKRAFAECPLHRVQHAVLRAGPAFLGLNQRLSLLALPCEPCVTCCLGSLFLGETVFAGQPGEGALRFTGFGPCRGFALLRLAQSALVLIQLRLSGFHIVSGQQLLLQAAHITRCARRLERPVQEVEFLVGVFELRLQQVCRGAHRVCLCIRRANAALLVQGFNSRKVFGHRFAHHAGPLNSIGEQLTLLRHSILKRVQRHPEQLPPNRLQVFDLLHRHVVVDELGNQVTAQLVYPRLIKRHQLILLFGNLEILGRFVHGLQAFGFARCAALGLLLFGAFTGIVGSSTQLLLAVFKLLEHGPRAAKFGLVCLGEVVACGARGSLQFGNLQLHLVGPVRDAGEVLPVDGGVDVVHGLFRCLHSLLSLALHGLDGGAARGTGLFPVQFFIRQRLGALDHHLGGQPLLGLALGVFLLGRCHVCHHAFRRSHAPLDDGLRGDLGLFSRRRWRLDAARQAFKNWPCGPGVTFPRQQRPLQGAQRVHPGPGQARRLCQLLGFVGKLGALRNGFFLRCLQRRLGARLLRYALWLPALFRCRRCHRFGSHLFPITWLGHRLDDLLIGDAWAIAGVKLVPGAVAILGKHSKQSAVSATNDAQLNRNTIAIDIASICLRRVSSLLTCFGADLLF